MNRKSILFICGTAGVFLLLGLIGGRYLLLPHAAHDMGHLGEPAEGEGKAAEAMVWSCSMHPQIQQTEPGSCPICGMDLIPLRKDVGADDGPRTLVMSESAKALADVQTTEVLQKFPEAQVRLVGKLEYDETRVKSLTARFPARIDELFVNYTGIPVKTGEHLARVYSPELLTAQRELLSTISAGVDSSIARTARVKLRLWDLLPEQIEAIIERGEASEDFVLKSPISGVVVAKHIKEGDYVKTGDALFKIVDLSRLWLFLDAYESDLTWLRYGQEVTFTVEAYPGDAFRGKIAFIEPEVNRRTRTVPIRVNVSNMDKRLKPGMFARGVVHSRIAYQGRVFAPELAGMWICPMHPEIVKDGPETCDICRMDLVRAEELGYVQDIDESAPLVAPASAVLRTGKRAVVYVALPNTERPSFEGREIILGARAGDVYIVESGLGAGEMVVTNGAFKIDSALQIQAKPSMMNPQGGGPVPGHDHGAGSGAGPVPRKTDEGLTVSVAMAEQLMESYFGLQDSLATDDLTAAKENLRKMMTVAGHSGVLPAKIHAMLATESLDALRLPHFEDLSDALITAVKADPAVFSGEILQMHCPMAKGNQGADWLQSGEPLRNPYFGAAMPGCGEVKGNLAVTSNGHAGHGH